jgi:hypothetical protein
MQQAGEGEIGIFSNPLAIKAGEERGGRRSIETLVVVKDFDFQSTPQSIRNSPLGALRRAR